MLLRTFWRQQLLPQVDSDVILANSNLIDGGLSIGEMFGFAGLVAIMLMFALGYIGYLLVNSWIKNQATATQSNIDNHTKLVAAQTDSYRTHITFAEKTQEAVVRITESTEQTHKLLEALATGSIAKLMNFEQVTAKVNNTDRMVRDCIRLIANQPETPQNVKEGLHRILDHHSD